MTIIYNKDIDAPHIDALRSIQLKTDNDNDIIVGSSDTLVVHHHNYLEYLELAWKNHLGVVIDPKFFWHMLLMELVGVIAKNPDDYRDIFTSSEEQKHISVSTNDPVVIPVYSIMEQLHDLVPTDTKAFFPDFTTIDEKYQLAASIAFCDMVSPFYSYSMYMCGIPSYTINGTQEDWELLSNSAEEICKLLKVLVPFNSALITLNKLKSADYRAKLDTWLDMFDLDPCGSGSQTELSGWISSFYISSPMIRYISNYASHIGSITYTNDSTNEKFSMYSGLFNSELIDGIITPSYEWVVKPVTEDT